MADDPPDGVVGWHPHPKKTPIVIRMTIVVFFWYSMLSKYIRLVWSGFVRCVPTRKER